MQCSGSLDLKLSPAPDNDEANDAIYQPLAQTEGRGNASQPNKASRPFKLRVQTQRSIYELKNASPSTSCISHTTSRFTPGFQPNLANKLPRQQHCRCCAAYARLCRSPCKQHTVAAPPAHSSTHTSIWQTSSNRVRSCFFGCIGPCSSHGCSPVPGCLFLPHACHTSCYSSSNKTQ